MKKIVLVLFLVFVMSGCTKYVAPSLENTNVSSESGNQVVVAPDECSAENPPRVGSSKVTEEALNLCGQKTDFSAKDYSEYGYILYLEQTSHGYNNDRYALKTISTTAPFTQNVLRENLPYDYLNGAQEVDSDSEKLLISYLVPERGFYLFIFNPKTKEFVALAQSTQRDLDGEDVPYSMFIASSQKPETESFTDKTATTVQAKLAACNFNESWFEEKLSEFVRDFPEKLNCYNEEVPGKIVGYIDLATLKYISIK